MLSMKSMRFLFLNVAQKWNTDGLILSINLQGTNDMLLVPDAVQQMKLKALQDEIQQTNYVLYCLWNILIHDV